MAFDLSFVDQSGEKLLHVKSLIILKSNYWGNQSKFCTSSRTIPDLPSLKFRTGFESKFSSARPDSIGSIRDQWIAFPTISVIFRLGPSLHFFHLAAKWDKILENLDLFFFFFLVINLNSSLCQVKLKLSLEVGTFQNWVFSVSKPFDIFKLIHHYTKFLDILKEIES